MLSPGFVLFLSAAYLGLLFAVARFGDARADAGKSIISANVYALSLAVYCTSWTFYGSVGRFLFGGWRMKRANPMRQRLAALGLLGVPLLTYPLLSLPQGEIAGIPAPYLYLFGMWTLLIVLAAVVAERRGK